MVAKFVIVAVMKPTSLFTTRSACEAEDRSTVCSICSSLVSHESLRHTVSVTATSDSSKCPK
jgi:hypothetical protein